MNIPHNSHLQAENTFPCNLPTNCCERQQMSVRFINNSLRLCAHTHHLMQQHIDSEHIRRNGPNQYFGSCFSSLQIFRLCSVDAAAIVRVDNIGIPPFLKRILIALTKSAACSCDGSSVEIIFFHLFECDYSFFPVWRQHSAVHRYQHLHHGIFHRVHTATH